MSKYSIFFTLVLIAILPFKSVFATTWRPKAVPSECYKSVSTVENDFFKAIHSPPCEVVEAADDSIEKLKDAEEICIDWIRENPSRYRGSSGVENAYKVIMQHRRSAAAKCESASPEPAWKPMSYQELGKKLRDEGVFK